MKLPGLSTEEVKEAKLKYGSNVIPESEPKTFWSEFKETFGDPMIKILLSIAIIMIGMFLMSKIFPKLGIEQTIYEPIGTIVAVFLVATIQAKTGVASDSKYRDLKNRSEKDKCKVLRNEELKVINVDELTMGDIVLLQSGDKIPADGILYEGNLKVDNSALNGEAEECHKKANPEAHIQEKITGDTFVDESSLFRGALVIDGEGYMQIQAIGTSTMMGKMALEMTEEEVDSPLKVKLAKLANQISIFGYCAAIFILVAYLTSDIIKGGGLSYFTSGWQNILNDIIQALDIAILIVVCAVPEGLPLMISLVLMQNTSRMLDHNVLVRKAQGIETAGSLNILFSDKTGTITKGHLEVVEVFDGKGKPKVNRDKLKLAITKNTQSKFDDKGNVIGGNFTDQALARYIGLEEFNNVNATIVKEQGFNSSNKFSQAEIKDLGVVYKGAPEKLLQKCRKFITEDGKLETFNIEEINPKIDEMANKAMRMLCFAYKPEASLIENTIQEDLILIGLASIRDDVRLEAKDAIKEVKKAGIQVVMITGDRLETAKAIAKDAGLIENDSDKALTSQELNDMSDEEVKAIIKDIRVIARALPTDKSRMVRLCQEMNLVCGMTGDGVNDSPALKKADVGFAMGSGTEAAKEAGAIVILDDNFRSIKDAIWYGRTIYHNILKFCKFQLTINVAAVLVCLLAPLFGLQSPLKVVHLLFVNLVMDGLGAMMLGNEPALEKYMEEKPRRRDESIISKNMLGAILVPALYLTALSFAFLKLPTSIYGSNGQINSMYFAFFIWSALWNGFNVRSERFEIFKRLHENPGFLKVLLIIILVQAAIINLSLIPFSGCAFISQMFAVTAFSLRGWITVACLSFTIIPIDCIRKLFSR